MVIYGSTSGEFQGIVITSGLFTGIVQGTFDGTLDGLSPESPSVLPAVVRIEIR